MDTDEQFNENVATIALLRARSHRGLSRHQRRIERFTAEVARPRSLYTILAVIVGWVALNLSRLFLGEVPFDPPPFSGLQGLVSLVALMVTTMVLITQSRQTRDLEQRAELELQINLLAEQKIAKLIALVEELRRDIPTVSNRVDPVAEVMQEPVDPHAVLSALERVQEPSLLPEEPLDEGRPSAEATAPAEPRKA